jgi:hypothetical protein
MGKPLLYHLNLKAKSSATNGNYLILLSYLYADSQGETKELATENLNIDRYSYF